MRGVRWWLAIGTPLIVGGLTIGTPLNVGGLALGSWTVAGATAAPRAPLAQAAPPPGPSAAGSVLVLNAPRAEGDDARGLRLALVAALALALAGGVVVQWHQSGDGRRTTPHHPRPAGGGRQPKGDNGNRRGARPGGEPGRIGAAPVASAPQGPGEGRRDEGPGPAVGGAMPALSPAQAQCTRAVAAAFSYDRVGTVAAFTAALTSDPGVKPTATPSFWDLPSTGHADLARAYLRCGRPLDARSVLTVALLSFRHNRELETLLRKTTPHWDAGRPTG